jgi:MFS family permease
MGTRLIRMVRANRDLLGVCIATTFCFMVFTMPAPLVPLLTLRLTGSPGAVGIVLSVSVFGSLFIAVPGGYIIQRFGVRVPLTATMAGIAACALALNLVQSYGFLFVGLSLYEVGKILAVVALQAYVASLSGDGDSSHDFGWYAAAASIGQMVGPPISGAAIDVLGDVNAWLVMAGAAALSAALVPALVRERQSVRPSTAPAASTATDAAAGPRAVERSPQPGERRRFSIRAFSSEYLSTASLVAIAASFTVVFGLGTRLSFYPVYMQGLGYSATVIGTMLAIRAGTSISVRMLMGWIIRKAGGRFPAMIGAMSVLAVAVGTTPLCRGVVALALNSVAVGIGVGLALPLSMAVVSGNAASGKRGVAMGVRLTGNRLAQVINPVFYGGLSEWKGIPTAFAAGGVLLAAVATPVFLWWRRARAE